MARLRKRTTRRKRRGGAPWTSTNWPGGGVPHNATYYPLNSYGGQIDRVLRNNVGGTRKRLKR